VTVKVGEYGSPHVSWIAEDQEKEIQEKLRAIREKLKAVEEKNSNSGRWTRPWLNSRKRWRS